MDEGRFSIHFSNYMKFSTIGKPTFSGNTIQALTDRYNFNGKFISLNLDETHIRPIPLIHRIILNYIKKKYYLIIANVPKYSEHIGKFISWIWSTFASSVDETSPGRRNMKVACCCCCLLCEQCISNLIWVNEEILIYGNRLRSTHCREFPTFSLFKPLHSVRTTQVLPYGQHQRQHFS